MPVECLSKCVGVNRGRGWRLFGGSQVYWRACARGQRNENSAPPLTRRWTCFLMGSSARINILGGLVWHAHVHLSTNLSIWLTLTFLFSSSASSFLSFLSPLLFFGCFHGLWSFSHRALLRRRERRRSGQKKRHRGGGEQDEDDEEEKGEGEGEKTRASRATIEKFACPEAIPSLGPIHRSRQRTAGEKWHVERVIARSPFKPMTNARLRPLGETLNRDPEADYPDALGSPLDPSLRVRKVRRSAIALPGSRFTMLANLFGEIDRRSDPEDRIECRHSCKTLQA